MDESGLCAKVAARSGASETEVEAVAREFFTQAFAMAVERGGVLVVPHFATFKCRPRGGGGMIFHFRPRKPEELIAAAERRRGKLSGRKASGGGRGPRPAARLEGAPYVPRPVAPPARQAQPVKKAGFLARLLGLGG